VGAFSARRCRCQRVSHQAPVWQVKKKTRKEARKGLTCGRKSQQQKKGRN
jgi:hypothetical protein